MTHGAIPQEGLLPPVTGNPFLLLPEAAILLSVGRLSHSGLSPLRCLKHLWAALGAQDAMAWKPTLNSQSLGWVVAGNGRVVNGGIEVRGQVTGSYPGLTVGVGPNHWVSQAVTINSHDDFEVVRQEVRSILSLTTVLPSLEKG